MFNPMSLKDHHIVVTGAAQGIGEAVARLVVSLGGRVTLVDVQGDKLKPLKAELGDAHADFRVGSVSDPQFVQHMVDEVVHQHGPIHGLVNNAGIVRAEIGRAHV